jgi:hypothetical protein
MVAEVQAAGSPDLSKGREVSAAMIRELGTFKPILVEAQGRARKLPVGKPVRFTKQAQTLGAGREVRRELPRVVSVESRTGRPGRRRRTL